jgi:hypothetical protein
MAKGWRSKRISKHKDILTAASADLIFKTHLAWPMKPGLNLRSEDIIGYY